MRILEIGDWIQTPPLIVYGGRRTHGRIVKVERLEGTYKYVAYFPLLHTEMIIYQEQLEFDTSVK
jgi:hypothetical protein